jgi:peptide/nickel transport system substrate-binding protein
MKRLMLAANILIVAAVLLSACATPTPEVIEKVVEKEVTREVEKVITQVVKETVKETVIVEGTPQVVEKEVTKVVEKVVTATPEPARTTGPKYGGTLIVAQVPTGRGIDVASQSAGTLNEISQQYYETLFDRDSSGEVKGLLVKEATVSDDGLVHTWTLQPNVKFHDGSDLTAEVVKWNLDRRIEKKYPLADLVPWDTIEAVDDLTVKVTLTRPSPSIFGNLAAKSWSIYSRDLVEKVGDEGMELQASGTGPFMVEEYVPNEVLKLVKNPDYWQEGLPYLDAITYVFVPDINTRATMLEAGDIDMAANLSIQDILRFKDYDDISIIEGVGSRQYYITMNNLEPPLDDPKVRLAINHAVDKQGIVDTVFQGLYSVATSPIFNPIIDGHYNLGPYEYDPDKARALLEEAGWTVGDRGIREKDGQKLIIDLHTRKGSTAGDIEIAELVQAMLLEVGISVEIALHDSAGFIFTVTKPPEEAEYDMINLTWGTYTGDGEYIMRNFYSCEAWAPIRYNRAYYCNEEVEALINASLEAPTMEARNEIYAEALKTIYEDAPFLMLFDQVAFMATRGYVKGVYFDAALINFPVKYAWLDK